MSAAQRSQSACDLLMRHNGTALLPHAQLLVLFAAHGKAVAPKDSAALSANCSGHECREGLEFIDDHGGPAAGHASNAMRIDRLSDRSVLNLTVVLGW